MPFGSPRQRGSKWGEIEEPDEGPAEGPANDKKKRPGAEAPGR
jgi:hypothetical protein